MVVPVAHAAAQGAIERGRDQVDTRLDQPPGQQALLSPGVAPVAVARGRVFQGQIERAARGRAGEQVPGLSFKGVEGPHVPLAVDLPPQPIELFAQPTNIDRSSWVALRQFPQLHTNPVNVIVGRKPIRASRKSAQWCIGTIEQLWRVRGNGILASERDEAHETFQRAIEHYRRIAAEAPEGS